MKAPSSIPPSPSDSSPSPPQNDVHNRIQAQDGGGSYCAATKDAAGRCFGGYARIAAVLEAARIEDPGWKDRDKRGRRRGGFALSISTRQCSRSPHPSPRMHGESLRQGGQAEIEGGMEAGVAGVGGGAGMEAELVWGGPLWQLASALKGSRKPVVAVSVGPPPLLQEGRQMRADGLTTGAYSHDGMIGQLATPHPTDHLPMHPRPHRVPPPIPPALHAQRLCSWMPATSLLAPCSTLCTRAMRRQHCKGCYG